MNQIDYDENFVKTRLKPCLIIGLGCSAVSNQGSNNPKLLLATFDKGLLALHGQELH